MRSEPVLAALSGLCGVGSFGGVMLVALAMSEVTPVLAAPCGLCGGGLGN